MFFRSHKEEERFILLLGRRLVCALQNFDDTSSNLAYKVFGCIILSLFVKIIYKIITIMSKRRVQQKDNKI